MSFTPLVPLGGVPGLRFLSRTLPMQEAALARAPEHARPLAHFRATMPGIASAEALVADRRLLTVTLGAFGLDDDLPNRFFIRRVLEGGAEGRDALAMRLADSRYREMAATLGFDRNPPLTRDPALVEELATRYVARQVERAVGAQDENLRLALNARRELPGLARRAGDDDVRWLRILGNPPLRKVVETALGLPKEFAALDLDRQVVELRRRARPALGIDRVEDLGRPETLGRMIDRFLFRAQASQGPAAGTPGLAALTLLQSTRRLF